jgi:ADP-heptose:LPS heptosyltransferase
VEENGDVVRFLGWPETEPAFPLAFPRQPRTEPWPKIALAPVSRWQTKNWPMDHFVKLAEILMDNGASVFLVGGPADVAAAGPLVERMKGRENFHDFCGKTDLVGLGGLLQEMDLAITVDSGPMHMAAALGVPVLAIFGPTDPSRTGPYGPQHRIIGVDHLPCRPCFSDTCTRGDHACMRNLFPSTVLDAAAAMLNPLRQEV